MDSVSEIDLVVLNEGVVCYGRFFVVGGNVKLIVCFVWDEQIIVVGVVGCIEFNCLFVSYFWVVESLRLKGFGSKVLFEFEYMVIC